MHDRLKTLFRGRPQREAQERALELLAAAIEGMSELFVLWDKDDRMVLCNQRVREFNQPVLDYLQPGGLFQDYIRAGLDAGLFPEAIGREEKWYAERLAFHANPSGPIEQQRQDGLWLLVNEQRFPDGSTATISTDITERVRAEQVIRDGEQRLLDFASVGADWFWEQDADLRFCYVSGENQGVTGMAAKDYYGLTRRETEPGDISEEELLAHEAQLLAREPFHDFQFSRKRPDGTKTFLSVSGKPIWDANGDFAGYRGVGRDITAQIDAERLARDSQDRLAAAIEGISEIFSLWDSDDRLVICNNQFRKLNEAIIETTQPGTTFHEHLLAAINAGIVPEATGREDAWLAERMARHTTPTEPFEMKRQDGHWLLVHEQRLPDGATATITADITRQKNAELALRQSEQRFLDFASVGADWFWEQDADLRFVYVSQENESVTGMRANDHYGMTRRETILGDVTEEELLAHEAQIMAHEPFHDFQFSRKRPDGSKIFLNISGKPIWDANGDFAGYRGVGRDVTPLVEARNALIDARLKAEDANRAKSEFLARMSHDLRTPLNAILGFSEIIETQIMGDLPDSKYATYARHIRESGEILLNLVSDVLDLSKIEAGKYELAVEPIEIGDLFDELKTLFTHQAAVAHIDLGFDAGPVPAQRLMADRRAVHQMLMNLISNALKFTDPGGKITVSLEDRADALALAVADTGIGFDMAMADRVREPFGRAVDQVSEHREGTGLGLAIVDSLMRLHGGVMELDSTPGLGTTVTLLFPSRCRVASKDQVTALGSDAGLIPG